MPRSKPKIGEKPELSNYARKLLERRMAVTLSQAVVTTAVSMEKVPTLAPIYKKEVPPGFHTGTIAHLKFNYGFINRDEAPGKDNSAYFNRNSLDSQVAQSLKIGQKVCFVLFVGNEKHPAATQIALLKV